MNVFVKTDSGLSWQLNSNDFNWNELHFPVALGVSMQSEFPEKRYKDCDYWSSFTDLMIKYKNFEPHLWHVHSFVNFINNNNFLQTMPNASASMKKLQRFFHCNCENMGFKKDDFIIEIDRIFSRANDARILRNKLVHRPWANQGTKIGIAYLENKQFSFDEISLIDMQRALFYINNFAQFLVKIFIGFQNGFMNSKSITEVSQSKKISYDGFMYLQDGLPK